MPYKRKCDKLKWNRENSHKWKHAIRESNRRCQQQVTSYVKSVKGAARCAFCCNADPDVLQAHHVDRRSKCFNVSKRGKASLRKVRDELDKCIWLCANCHAKVERQIERQSQRTAEAKNPQCEILDCYRREGGGA